MRIKVQTIYNNHMKTNLTLLFLTIFFIAWFSFITPQDRFADPDAFYHITVAKLISKQGPLTDFPWLDLTSLGANYADQHFLFHVLQIPFLKIFEPLQAARISAITFAVLCLLTISAVFYKLNVKLWWLWPILLALTQPFATRLIQGKASPLAILLWFVGVGTVLYLLQRDKLTPTPLLRSREGLQENLATPPLLILREGAKGVSLSQSYFLLIIFLVSLLFTLTHGGWILLPVSILLGDIFYLKLTNQSAKFHILDSRFLSLFASISGCLVGFFMHPNRGEMFNFLKVQLYDIAIATPEALRLGTEWNANNLAGSISMLGIFGIILLLTALARINTQDKGLKNNDENNTSDVGRATWDVRRSALILAPLFILLFIASIKSLRFTEYFQPLLALVTAFAATTINWKQFLNKLSLKNSEFGVQSSVFDKLIPGIIALALLMIIAQHMVTAYSTMHHAPRFMNNQYQTPLQAISALAQPGDRVYHSMWDEFPILFYQDQNLRYISGLDPTFLYKSSSTLALDYQNLVFNSTSTEAQTYSLIHDRLSASFILIDHDRWPDLNELISSDPRYQKLAEGNGATAYQVTKSP